MNKKILFGVIIVLALMQYAAAAVRIESVSLDPSYIEPGDEVDIYVKFREYPVTREVWSGVSPGYSGKTLVTENLNLSYTAKLIPANDISKEYVTIVEGKRNVGHLYVGETWTTPLKVKVHEDTPAASYELEFQLLDTDEMGGEKELMISQKISLPVKGIVEFDVKSKDTLRIGSVGEINLVITNIGGGVARDTTVTLNATDPLTVLESNEAHIGNLKGGGKNDINFKVSVDSKTKVGSHEIPITIRYMNSSGSLVVLPKKIGVQITGEPNVEVTLESVGELKSGGSGKAVLRVVNNGFIDAKFLSLGVQPTEQYSVTSADKVYIGNLASDDFETEDFEIKISDNTPAGTIPLKGIVEYKKENSDELISKEFTVNLKVLSESEYASLKATNGKSSTTASLIYVIPGLIVGYLVLWFIYKLVNAITTYLNKRIFKRGL